MESFRPRKPQQRPFRGQWLSHLWRTLQHHPVLCRSFQQTFHSYSDPHTRVDFNIGWSVIIRRMLNALDALPEQPSILTIDDIDGQLVVTTSHPEITGPVISRVRAESLRTCHSCGRPGLLFNGMVLCTAHPAAILAGTDYIEMGGCSFATDMYDNNTLPKVDWLILPPANQGTAPCIIPAGSDSAHPIEDSHFLNALLRPGEIIYAVSPVDFHHWLRLIGAETTIGIAFDIREWIMHSSTLSHVPRVALEETLSFLQNAPEPEIRSSLLSILSRHFPSEQPTNTQWARLMDVGDWEEA
ncbi:protein of unknown function [Magnetospirillum gryphiswaldense MSR-1 v2]|uniref:Uncharacterized protein n=1 Tax=Magnetospirillum gryphiswaldense (strain DSM 6361 / JCM 21280 / NBRC 15271 / MSR-1) TaxID=431944 RepID=V6F8I0_MAGGM|nr:hypothetical protein [Magnetospirillum gryphiswaldense]CDL00993.1 protein of unknown function [Magnetospirillum gryphiswaldense MSR-1 v2]